MVVPTEFGLPVFSLLVTLKTVDSKLSLLSPPTCLMSPPKSPDAIPLRSIHQSIMKPSVVQKTTVRGTFRSC